jgi:hypothetical protein
MQALAAFAVAILVVGCNPQPASIADTKGAGTVEAALADDLRALIAAGSNYDPSQVEVRAHRSQLEVIVTNSNLLDAPHDARDADAERIAHLVEGHLSANTIATNVIAIHVDYVSFTSPGAPRMVDSMDFRKDRQGKFRKDMS